MANNIVSISVDGLHYPNLTLGKIVAQPFRDFNNPKQIIPKWQKDMAQWANRRELWASCDFKQFEPRKGFVCGEYFKLKEL